MRSLLRATGRSFSRLYAQYPRALFVGALLVVVSVLTYWFVYVRFSALLPRSSIAAAGRPKGTYQRVIRHLVDRLSEFSDELGFEIELKEVESVGSIATLQQIGERRVDFGIVQGNSDFSEKHVGGIATLYQEVYFWFTNEPHANNLYDFAQQAIRENRKIRIASLGKGSQTLEDLHLLLEYYGFPPEVIEHVNCDYEQCASALEQGSVNVAFYVAGLHNETVRRLSRNSKLKQISFSNREGFLQTTPQLSLFTIEPGALGSNQPSMKVDTFFTPAVLVAGRHLNEGDVQSLTSVLLRNHREIESGIRFLSIRPVNPALGIPVHPAAVAASTEQSSFWNRYEKLFWFIFSVVSCVVAVAGFAFQLWKHYADSKRGRQKDDAGPGSEPRVS